MGLIAYNLAMAIQLVAVLFIQRYSRRPAPIRSTAGFAMAAIGVASLIALGVGPYVDPGVEGTFAMMAMWAYGLFVHLPLLLVGQAWLLNRRRARIPAVIAVMMVLALVAVAIDAFLIEPFDVQVDRVSVRSSKLDRRYRLAVLSDIQTDAPGAYEREVFRLTMAERPDAILMPGDYIHASGEAYSSSRDELASMLEESGLSAPLGIHAVQGNVDPDGRWTPLFDGLPAAVYPSTSTAALAGLSLTALSFRDSFDTDIVIPGLPGFHVVMGHGPDFALGTVSADLLIAGHTHGGQVQLPGIGPLITFSAVPRAWADGVTLLSGGRTLIVSRGIGMERGSAPRLRFLCRPQIVIIDLEPE